MKTTSALLLSGLVGAATSASIHSTSTQLRGAATKPYTVSAPRVLVDNTENEAGQIVSLPEVQYRNSISTSSSSLIPENAYSCCFEWGGASHCSTNRAMLEGILKEGVDLYECLDSKGNQLGGVKAPENPQRRRLESDESKNVADLIPVNAHSCCFEWNKYQCVGNRAILRAALENGHDLEVCYTKDGDSLSGVKAPLQNEDAFAELEDEQATS